MNTNPPLLIIDSHVHIHDCFDLSTFFESAAINCQAQATAQQHQGQILGVMLLTESSWDHWFQTLASWAEKGQTIENHASVTWSFHRTDEDFTLYTRSSQGMNLLIVAGRQIVTKEKLEVLGLLTNQRFQDGVSIEEAIQHVKESGGVPVIPWGFGKWWGTRGTILTQLMNSSVMTNVFLGDNSGRPNFLPYPSQFSLAAQLGIRIFPGSDPLPFLSENGRPCSVGFSVKKDVHETRPGADLRSILQDSATPIVPYFHHEGLFRFIKNQVSMQLVKHQPSPA